MSEQKTTQIPHSVEATNLAEVLERVLDKGIVIAGDIKIHLVDVELLTVKVRLTVASLDKAKEIGINWWETDSYLSSQVREAEAEKERIKLEKKVEELEKKLKPETE